MNINQLHFQSVSKWFLQGESEITVLDDISITFKKGVSYAIAGVSGAGKSTLLHICAGLEEISQGQVLLNETTNVNTLTSKQKEHLRIKALGLVLQSPYLIAECSALENVMIKGLIGGLSYAKAKQYALELLEYIGLKSHLDHLPYQLSGGQQQRVAIARSLMLKPDFLIADEPTGTLDEKTAHELINLLCKLKDKHNIGLIISSHDPYVMSRMDVALHLNNGKLNEQKNNTSSLQQKKEQQCLPNVQ